MPTPEGGLRNAPSMRRSEGDLRKTPSMRRLEHTHGASSFWSPGRLPFHPPPAHAAPRRAPMAVPRRGSSRGASFKGPMLVRHASLGDRVRDREDALTQTPAAPPPKPLTPPTFDVPMLEPAPQQSSGRTGSPAPAASIPSRTRNATILEDVRAVGARATASLGACGAGADAAAAAPPARAPSEDRLKGTRDGVSKTEKFEPISTVLDVLASRHDTGGTRMSHLYRNSSSDAQYSFGTTESSRKQIYKRLMRPSTFSNLPIVDCHYRLDPSFFAGGWYQWLEVRAVHLFCYVVLAVQSVQRLLQLWQVQGPWGQCRGSLALCPPTSAFWHWQRSATALHCPALAAQGGGRDALEGLRTTGGPLPEARYRQSNGKGCTEMTISLSHYTKFRVSVDSFQSREHALSRETGFFELCIEQFRDVWDVCGPTTWFSTKMWRSPRPPKTKVSTECTQGLVLWAGLKAQRKIRCEVKYRCQTAPLDSFVALGLCILEGWGGFPSISCHRSDQHKKGSPA